MKQVEITTAQNVSIEYELTSLRERVFGASLDFILASMGYGIFLFALRGIFGNGVLGWMPTHILVLVLPIAVFLFYNIVFEILNGGQTLGKMAISSKVVRLDGKDPEWGDVLLRSVLHLVDSIFSFGLIGALLVKTTAKSQRLGDMASGTTVIKIGSDKHFFSLRDILQIHSTDNHHVAFPQVRRLSEQDMIFIKTLLDRYQRFPNHAHEMAVEDLVTHLMPVLGITTRPLNRVEFLRSLLRDYIVLTR